MLGMPHVAHTLTAVLTSDSDVATPLSPTSLTYREAHKGKKKIALGKKRKRITTLSTLL